MTKFFLTIALFVPILCLAAADEEQPALRKKLPVPAEGAKPDPKAEPKGGAKVEPKKEPAEAVPEVKKEGGPADETDPEKLKERIVRNATAAGDRIEGKDTGIETRKLQDQNVRDIDELLKQMQNQSDSGGGGGGGGSPPPEGNGSSGGGKSSGKSGQSGSSSGGSSSASGSSSGSKSASQRRQERRQEPSGGAGQDKNDTLGKSGGKDKSPSGSGGKESGKDDGTAKGRNGGKEPSGSKEGGDKTAGTGKEGTGGTAGDKSKSEEPKKTSMNEKDAEKYRDVWGHLPEKLRQEMELYFREGLDPQHAEMLRQYYSALAERNRRKSK